MILVDTSVWIEYLRDTSDSAADELARLIGTGADIRLTEPIAMELLAGADTPHRHDALSRLVDGLAYLSIEPALDYRVAATLYVAAKRAGRTVRSLNDCLIAAVAVRTGASLFHRDRDFDALAEVTQVALHAY